MGSPLMYRCLAIATLMLSRVDGWTVQQRPATGARSTVYAGPACGRELEVLRQYRPAGMKAQGGTPLMRTRFVIARSVVRQRRTRNDKSGETGYA